MHARRRIPIVLRALLALPFALLLAGGAAHAQQPAAADTASTDTTTMELATPLDIGTARAGSGTSWLPDATRHQGMGWMSGGWALSLHGSVFLDYIAVSGTRNAGQFGSVNWAMFAAAHTLGGGLLRLRTMISAEALTIPEPGYPQLLQVASVYNGQPVSDREPAEAPVMELAALYERAVSSNVGVSFYVAPVGEPALGPVSYLHRPSAADDPLAPLSHFLQDITHVSDGVLTAGVFTEKVKLEFSLYNSAHPDPNTGYAYSVHLNGYSTRLSWNPMESWSFAAWAGHLAASTGAHSHDASTRLGASALYVGAPSPRGAWAASFVWGAELPTTGGRLLNSVLAESSVEFGATTLFGRGEYVQRTPAQLGLIGAVPPVSDVGALTLGASRRVLALGSFVTSLGAAGTLTVVSADLDPFYGGQYLLGGLLFAKVGLHGAHVMH